MKFNPNLLVLRPYIPGHTDPELFEYLWCRMRKENKLQNFCAIQDPNTWGPEDWERKLSRPDATLVVAYYIGEIIGFVMLEHIRLKRAEGHWMIFNPINRIRILAGREVIKRLLNIFELDVIYGFTPEVFEPGIKYLKIIGGQCVGNLPKGSYINDLSHSVDSAIFAFTRGG